MLKFKNTVVFTADVVTSIQVLDYTVFCAVKLQITL